MLIGSDTCTQQPCQSFIWCNSCNYLFINVQICLKMCTFRNITNYWFFCKNTLLFCTFWCIIL